MAAESRNKTEARREENGVVYYDRGILKGNDGKSYQRYAVQTHFIEVGEDKCELVERYIRPLYKMGDAVFRRKSNGYVRKDRAHKRAG